MFSKLVIISEYSYIEETADGIFADNTQEVSPLAFDNLWTFCHSDVSDFPDIDKVFSKTIRRNFRRIQTKNYVGTVQTADGTIFEILPKVYKKSTFQEGDINQSRAIFLRMLASVKNTNAAFFQNLQLQIKDNFPILEHFISNYISNVEELYNAGLLRNYVTKQSNQDFIKGRILIEQNIRENSVDKTKFFVQYQEYNEQIPQNRIVVSTLLYLKNITTSFENASRIGVLLNLFSDIPASSDIHGDIAKSKNFNRLSQQYESIILWSEAFLLGKGFTVFHGSCLNNALLFPAEKLFESFIAKLFKEYFSSYSKDFSVHAQHSKYFLVDSQRQKGRFRLRPDIFVETPQCEYPVRSTQSIIIDTKWKVLDQSRPDKNYLIDIKDMYQLYAYGQKYKRRSNSQSQLSFVPRLVLLYPCSKSFNKPIDEYIFDENRSHLDLRLLVESFDLTTDYNGYMMQIDSLLSRINKDSLLIACFKDNVHLKWILENKLYNIRAYTQDNPRAGALKSSAKVFAPTRLMLYDVNDPSVYHLFSLDPSFTELVSSQTLATLGYTFTDESNCKNKYFLYRIVEELSDQLLEDPSVIVREATGYDLLHNEIPESIKFDPGTPIVIDNFSFPK